ncbi:MAG: UvrB/UvrC motif-containing protein [Planctomycetota bacterium]|nr:UvrB/UvrC motif-containing protein [Planctomycetota bacterium]
MSAMVCQSCGENPATFHLTEISDEPGPSQKTVELHFCEECATAAGHTAEASVPSLMAQAVASVAATAGAGLIEGLACPHCGMTFQEFKRKGRLGCPRDYEAFATPLDPMLQKMHACTSPRHHGRVPRGPFKARNVVGDRLLQLRRELQNAVGGERYEEAARVRDEIQRIEHQGVDLGESGLIEPGDPLGL